jgi:hypothetical protein
VLDTNCRAPYRFIGNRHYWIGPRSAGASLCGPRRGPARAVAILAGALAGLLAASAGCDTLWSPYEQEVFFPDGGSGNLEMGPDQSGDGGPTYPATCAQASRGGMPQTGMVKLYVNGDPDKPWTALCELSGNQVQEFLQLQSATSNYSQYTAGGQASGTTVRTVYSAVRIDPLTLKINCGDQSHAKSSGRVDHPDLPNPSIPVTSMPYGVAMGCDGTANGSGQIDLSGTPFAVVPSAFATGGYMAMGGASYGNGNRSVTLTGGGQCGWLNPKPGVFNPVNADTSVELPLVYSPM